MASLSHIGRVLGFGERAHVFEATTDEGKPIALKAYHAKPSCKKELGIYEYLKESGCHPTYLPQYHGPISLSPDQIRIIESALQGAQWDTAANIYRVGIGIERVEGSCLGEIVNKMTDSDLKSLEEKILAALSDLHKTAEICHKDIKANNILLLPPHNSRSDDFVIIDFSEGIIRKDMNDVSWKKACKEDKQALRDIFNDAWSSKAVLAGCQLIQDATTISHPVLSGTNTPKSLSDDVQMQLSHFLKHAESAKSVSCLIDRILDVVEQPICKLAIALVRTLRRVGRFSDALRVLDHCDAVGSDSYDTALSPLFEYHRAKVLQSLGFDSMLYFEKALSGFEAQLGADHITTQSCRYELAVQYACSSDIARARTILAGLAQEFASKKFRTRKEKSTLSKSKPAKAAIYPELGVYKEKAPCRYFLH